GGRARVRSCSNFFESKGMVHVIPDAFFSVTVVSDLPNRASAWRTCKETNAVASGSNATRPSRAAFPSQTKVLLSLRQTKYSFAPASNAALGEGRHCFAVRRSDDLAIQTSPPRAASGNGPALAARSRS